MYRSNVAPSKVSYNPWGYSAGYGYGLPYRSCGYGALPATYGALPATYGALPATYGALPATYGALPYTGYAGYY
jgi:morphogenetic protein associated with SpoVID